MEHSPFLKRRYIFKWLGWKKCHVSLPSCILFWWFLVFEVPLWVFALLFLVRGLETVGFFWSLGHAGTDFAMRLLNNKGPTWSPWVGRNFEEIWKIHDGNQEGTWGSNQSILISKARKYKFDQRLHGFFKDQPGMPTLRNFNSHVAGTTFKKDCHAQVMLEPAPQISLRPWQTTFGRVVCTLNWRSSLDSHRASISKLFTSAINIVHVIVSRKFNQQTKIKKHRPIPDKRSVSSVDFPSIFPCANPPAWARSLCPITPSFAVTCVNRWRTYWNKDVSNSNV